MPKSAGWYSRNKSRKYPLSPVASAIDDSGKAFGDNWIADLKFRLAMEKDAQPYISSLNSGGGSVSLAISVDGEVVATAVASSDAAQRREIVQLKSFNGLVDGFVVFGDHAPGYRFSFSGPQQSGISDSAVDKRRRFSDDSRFKRGNFGSLDSAIVDLLARGDLQITEGTREVEGEEYRQIAIGLRESGQSKLLLDYAGKCNQLVEGKNCGDPEPYMEIGQVEPDCCGRVFVEFRGCVELVPLLNQCGVGIICQATIDETCRVRVNEAIEQGILPTAVDDAPIVGEEPFGPGHPLYDPPLHGENSPEEITDPDCDTPRSPGVSDQDV